MAINKRTRSFSPYSYGVKYRRAGEDPRKVGKDYINSVKINPPLYVVSKISPSYFTFISTDYIYGIGRWGTKYRWKSI